MNIRRTRVNEMIKTSPIRLIDENGEQAGVTDIHKALEMARQVSLDLVEIAPNAQPPVCKIIDWGKFQYQESKKAQGTKTKQKKTVIKGIRIRPSTGNNDLNFKVEQAKKFLLKGNKVKVEIILRGREKAFNYQSREKLVTFIDKIDFPIKIEQDVKKQFNGFNVLLAPKE